MISSLDDTELSESWCLSWFKGPGPTQQEKPIWQLHALGMKWVMSGKQKGKAKVFSSCLKQTFQELAPATATRVTEPKIPQITML